MIHIDRRQLIATAAFGVGGLMLPGGAAMAQAWLAARGFTHNVASGEPDVDSVLLWTRFVGSGKSAHVRAEISETPDFATIIAKNEMITGPWRDWTVKITLDGLQPGRRYHYRFVAENGSMSPVGRTKTLPAGTVSAFNLAVFSCSNLPFGMFNAYGHAAARDDIDLVMHLGDYFYEYKRGGYPDDNPRWDLVQPQTELIHLADYRLRYASYRTDPDLQAIHNRHPMIVSMDDHESANDSWEGGAQNHQPDEEGVWSARRAAAMQAYREWMPIDDAPYKSYEIGALGTLFRTDTRLLMRSSEPEIDNLFGATDVQAALAKFKRERWPDPAVTMMGTTQESWLAHGLKASARAKKRWQVVGTGTIMGETYMPGEAVNWIAKDAAERSKRYTLNGIELAKAGLPFNFDNWGGYPAARARLLDAAQAAPANLVMLAGDSHNAWAYELSNRGRAVGVEFAGHAVTSPGYESSTQGTDPKVIAAALVKSSPELKWCDTSRRGYMRLALAPDVATNEWVFMDTIKTRSMAVGTAHRMRVKAGTAKLETVV
jgi:alkaline phosphatase D